jgi:hypothetical protein
MYNKISSTQIAHAYEFSKKVYEGNMSSRDATSELMGIGVNQTSAQFYIYIYKHLIDGDEFKRTASAESFAYFLNRISQDNGLVQLKKSLIAFEKHIAYLQLHRKSRINSLEAVYEKIGKLLIN